MKKRLIGFPEIRQPFPSLRFLAEALAERQAKSIARKEKIRRLGKSWKVGKESVELRDESFVDAILTLY